MKTKITFLVIVCAIITLSFTFATTGKVPNENQPSKTVQSEPIGGLISEETL